MQAQSTRTEAATTSAQSLAAVQTLLKASLGCITFLRDLLPSDNFTDSHFTTSDDSLLSQSSDSSQSIDNNRSNSRNVNGFKIMTMTRGYTDEADRILNYLEHGIFDALQKQYLRSFIFAIYLDEKDPTNIVEAYTFNFHYHTIPGTDTVIPVMSLGDDLDKMSLKDLGKDPIVQAAKKGKAPTLKDVKKSVKTLLKTLIHSTTQMDVLPKRRFATFKLFYTDETPAEYEPRYFQAGDAVKDKWFFMTHDLDEVPDKWGVGQLETGHHSVNLSIASIATYLPSSTENENAPFAGTTSRGPTAPTLTPVEEAAVRAEQAAKQSKDAETRNVVWSADAGVEGDDLDAEGDDDPDYFRNADGNFVAIGVRNEEGIIEPIPMDAEEKHFGGVSQTVPTRLHELNAQQRFDNTDLEQTQTFPDFHNSSQGSLPPSRGHSPSTSSGHGNPADLFDRNASLPSSDLMSPLTSASQGEEIDTQMLQDLVLDNRTNTEDSEMLDMETQVYSAEDPIQSFQDTAMEDQIEDMPTPKPLKKTQKKDVVDRGLQCECDVTFRFMTNAVSVRTVDAGIIYGVWVSIQRTIAAFRKSLSVSTAVFAPISHGELIKVDLYPKMISKFKDLALFRRAIKVAELNKPESVADFAPLIAGCNNVLARQLFKRLENEGFIVEQSTEIDDLGFAQTRSKSAKGKSKTKGKQPKQRKNVQKSKYTFNRASLSTTEYSDYFNPDHRVESRLLDLPQTKANVKSRPAAPAPAADASHATSTMGPPSLPPMTTLPAEEAQIQTETQTQEETQPFPLPQNNKRQLSNDGAPEEEGQGFSRSRCRSSRVGGRKVRFVLVLVVVPSVEFVGPSPCRSPPFPFPFPIARLCCTRITHHTVPRSSLGLFSLCIESLVFALALAHSLESASHHTVSPRHCNNSFSLDRWTDGWIDE
ncbi:HORMA domain-containing protein [Mycena venus]|uniref:HORMA domain-containing protein n=1 Tax=Mycena venus TaxID=2733690 RepID=A0A8H6XBD0_9AGAR|nr:HORMA domain-containing protein [Mycena venus]